jgi:hypothetical protein
VSLYVSIWNYIEPSINSNKVFIDQVTLTAYGPNGLPYKITPTNGYNGVTLFTLSVRIDYKDTQNNSLIDKFVYYCKLILKLDLYLQFESPSFRANRLCANFVKKK